jgi:hypothetical protein
LYFQNVPEKLFFVKTGKAPETSAHSGFRTDEKGVLEGGGGKVKRKGENVANVCKSGEVKKIRRREGP